MPVLANRSSCRDHFSVLLVAKSSAWISGDCTLELIGEQSRQSAQRQRAARFVELDFRSEKVLLEADRQAIDAAGETPEFV